MNRRTFLALTAAATAGFVLDPERLLWVPGQRTIFLPSAAQQRFWLRAGDVVVFGQGGLRADAFRRYESPDRRNVFIESANWQPLALDSKGIHGVVTQTNPLTAQIVGVVMVNRESAELLQQRLGLPAAPFQSVSESPAGKFESLHMLPIEPIRFTG